MWNKFIRYYTSTHDYRYDEIKGMIVTAEWILRQKYQNIGMKALNNLIRRQVGQRIQEEYGRKRTYRDGEYFYSTILVSLDIDHCEANEDSKKLLDTIINVTALTAEEIKIIAYSYGVNIAKGKDNFNPNQEKLQHTKIIQRFFPDKDVAYIKEIKKSAIQKLRRTCEQLST